MGNGTNGMVNEWGHWSSHTGECSRQSSGVCVSEKSEQVQQRSRQEGGEKRPCNRRAKECRKVSAVMSAEA